MPKPQQQHPQQQQQLQKQPQQLHEDTVQDWQRSQPQPIQTRQRLLTHTFPTLDGPLSPLDAIVRNGKQARRDVGTRPNLSQDLLSRAHSLSRSTSVKVAHPREVTEEPDGDDSHIPRAGPSSSRLAQSHQAGPSASPALIRRESVDTVRSSEFGEDGRWAQAWTKRPDDEESLFNDSDSQWDGESYRSVDVGWSSYAVPSEEHEYAQARAALQAPRQSTLLSSAAAGHHIVPSHPTASETAALRSPRGHPTGRMPPPPPSADSASGRPTSGMYHDPNAPYGQPLSEHDWTASLGKHRAAVLAAHDGRASLVSDLDVETLRLDGSSSRRSSTSTLALANQTSATPSSPTRASQGQRRSGETWRGRLSGEMQRANAAQAVAAYEQSERALQEHNAYSAHGHQAFTPSGRPGPALPSAPSFLDPPDVAAASYTSHMRQSDSHGTLPSSRSFGPQPTADAKSQSQHTVGPGRPQANAPLPPRPAPKQVSTSEELLSRGIEYHEAGDLVRSSLYFERSAKVEGGCVVGMCMYGMALREGWGAKKDQRRGFEWIQAAATRAGETLKVTQPRTDAEMHALKSELKLSVYELGKCYCYGWGVKLDKRMALEYFELAAKLGDADAQAEAGALYATGKGCKKDLKKAARYYRMAEAQGYDTVGLSWIHKDKYL
ncbi:hypothetical protein V8E36_002021 [Tilletia maclaganii]